MNTRAQPDAGRTGHGLTGFVARARELAEKYGDRFRPNDYLRSLAAEGGEFPA